LGQSKRGHGLRPLPNSEHKLPCLWYHRYMSPTGLRKHRERLGLSQQGLARRLGVARATVTRWENGTRHPSKVAELALRGVIEAKGASSWQRLAGAALNELWDNPEDAVYDAWQERYGSGAR
jgi:DNA-binding transcriptional regulator YiaG